MDAEHGDDLFHVRGPVGLAVVVVDPPADAVLLEAAAKDKLQGGKVALEAEPAVQKQSTVVVEERV